MKLNSLPCVKHSNTIVMSTTEQRSRLYNRQKKKKITLKATLSAKCSVRQRCWGDDQWGSHNWAVLMHMPSKGWGRGREADSIFISLNFRLHCLNVSVTSACIAQKSSVRSRRLKIKVGGKKKPTKEKKHKQQQQKHHRKTKSENPK